MLLLPCLKWPAWGAPARSHGILGQLTKLLVGSQLPEGRQRWTSRQRWTRRVQQGRARRRTAWATAVATHQQAVGIYNTRVAAKLGTKQPIDDCEMFKLLNWVREAGCLLHTNGHPRLACGEQPATPRQPAVVSAVGNCTQAAPARRLSPSILQNASEDVVKAVLLRAMRRTSGEHRISTGCVQTGGLPRPPLARDSYSNAWITAKE